KRITLPAGISILIVLIVYGWFISIGPWRERGSTSDYYFRMASAIRAGQLELEEKPDPALLALPNPYDHRARKGIPLLGDASLYKGNYYLYFGAFPSLPLALIISIYPVEPGDQVFVYIFLIGLFLVQSLLFIEIIHRFSDYIPVWTLPLGILVLGLTGPYTRMLSHPYIHEAAIAGGQLFFTLGFLFAFLALKEQPVHVGRLLLAGLFWAFSAATRTTQLAQIAFMIVLTWLYIAWKHRTSRLQPFLTRSTLALAGPLVICGIILAWYNWARFDSIFEFGLYYQLAAFNLQANYDILFSRIYIVQNIYNYFLNPFELTGRFPFFNALPGTEKPVLSSFELPNLYAVEGRFGGALVSTPFLLFSLVPVILTVFTFTKRLRASAGREDLLDVFDWTLPGLAGSSIAGALPTLLLFYVGFRYETEFIACLTVLALIGFSQGYPILKRRRARALFTILGISLAAFSILANLALAYSGMRG
ncbi:MAG TPA: hypothetical protein VFY26_21850, partial [Anaerolineales bacterium]|nr:hypothetical protein [Anaerolineales bacterium]